LYSCNICSIPRSAIQKPEPYDCAKKLGWPFQVYETIYNFDSMSIENQVGRNAEIQIPGHKEFWSKTHQSIHMQLSNTSLKFLEKARTREKKQKRKYQMQLSTSLKDHTINIQKNERGKRITSNG